MRALILLTLYAGLAGAAQLVPVDVPPLEGAEPEQRFGTDASRPYTPPADVINHPRAPVFAIDASEPDCKPLPYYRIAPDTYFLFGNIAEVDAVNRGFNGNSGFIVTREGVIVIDALGTPYLGRRLIATVRAVTDRPIRYLVITHAHPDHYYGASAFAALPEVKIISHAGTQDYAYSSTVERSVAYRKVFLPREMEGFHAVVPDILLGGGNPARSLSDLSDRSEPSGRARTVLHDFEAHSEPMQRESGQEWTALPTGAVDQPQVRQAPRLTLKLGGKSFDIYDVGHHHSHGDLVLHQVEDKILWVSDLAFNGRVTYLGDGHIEEILPMQDWVKKHFPDLALMVPGHGAPQTPPFPMLDFTGRYVQALVGRMQEALARGQGLAETVAGAGLPDYARAPLYELNHWINANHVYRVLEEQAF